MKTYISLLFALLFTVPCSAQSLPSDYEYNIAGVAIAKEGYYLVQVSAMVDKKKEATLDIAKKCAIHGCLFKGFAFERLAQKPMITLSEINSEQQNVLNDLIDKQYETFTVCTQPIQIVKVQKRYRVTAVVAVAKDMLRDYLEKEGIVNKLGL